MEHLNEGGDSLFFIRLPLAKRLHNRMCLIRNSSCLRSMVFYEHVRLEWAGIVEDGALLGRSISFGIACTRILPYSPRSIYTDNLRILQKTARKSKQR